MKRSPENDRLRLEHMWEASQLALRFTDGHTRAALAVNRILYMALCYAVQIIGEAANHLTSDFIEHHNDVPWSSMIGMRHRLVHGYNYIDTDELWYTVVNDLPPLIAQLESILSAGDKS